MPRLRCKKLSAFVLLEVLVSLAIMGVALSMVLRSFSLSMKASSQAKRTTIGVMLARSLIEEWEIVPPREGFTSGDFGEKYPGYFYQCELQNLALDYPDASLHEETNALAQLPRVSLTVFFATERERDRGERAQVIHLESALTGAERFNAMARVRNEIETPN